MRVVVIGAGLGGLATALRLQGAGCDVTVVEQRAAARRPRLPAARRGLHVGHGPVAAHDAVGARGDVRGGRPRPARGGDAAPARPAVPDPLGRRAASTSTSATTRRGCARRWRSSRRADAARVEPFLAALRPIYEQGILGAGRRAVPRRPATSRGSCPPWCGSARCGRCTRSWRASSRTRACARRSRSTRCSSAATRTACRRSTPRSSTSRCSTAAGTPTAACTRSSRRWRGRSTCAAASAVERDRARGRPRHRRAAGRRRAPAGRRRSSPTPTSCARTSSSAAAPPRRRLRETMSCFLLYLGTDRRVRAAAAPHAARRAGYREFIRAVTRGRELPRTLLHLRPRAGAHGARDGGGRRRLARRAAAGPEPARRDRLGPRGRPAARRAARRPRGELRAGRPGDGDRRSSTG